MTFPDVVGLWNVQTNLNKAVIVEISIVLTNEHLS